MYFHICITNIYPCFNCVLFSHAESGIDCTGMTKEEMVNIAVCRKPS